MYNLNTIFERRDGKILCKDFQTLITERNVYIYIYLYYILIVLNVFSSIRRKCNAKFQIA